MASMGGLPGEVTISQAARLLGLHRDTVRSYALKALGGEPSAVSHVRRSRNRYIWLRRDEVLSLRRRIDEEIAPIPKPAEG